MCFVTLLLAQLPSLDLVSSCQLQGNQRPYPTPAQVLAFLPSLCVLIFTSVCLVKWPCGYEQLKNKETTTQEDQVQDCSSDLRCQRPSGYHTLSQKQPPCLTDNKLAVVVVCSSQDATWCQSCSFISTFTTAATGRSLLLVPTQKG